MDYTNPASLKASTQIYAPIEKIWKLWTTPDDIMQWNNLSDEWHNIKVENDIRTGGRFRFVMGLKDGSFTFDYAGTYNEVVLYQCITCTLNDGRRSVINFQNSDPVVLTETFDPTPHEPMDMQLNYCQAVLNSFQKYAEGQ